MMQITAPAQTPGSADGALPGEPGPGKAKALKNDKLGGFSKILEGLLKTKSGDPQGLLAKGTVKTPQAGLPTAQKEALLPKTPGKKKSASLGPAEKPQKDGPQKTARRAGGNKTPESTVLAGAGADGTGNNALLKTPAADTRIGSKEKKAEKLSPNGEKNPQPAVQAEPQSPSAATQTLARLVSEPEPQDPKIRKPGDKKADPDGLQPAAPRRTSAGSPASVAPPQPAGQSEKTGTKAPDPKANGKRRLTAEVRDLRPGEPARQDQAQALQPAGDPQPLGDAKTVDLTLDLSLGNKSREAAFRDADPRPAQAFEDILARELHQNLNGDIVRQAQIILREHGEGTIRLSLKPESLGNVKIQLEMAENKITGHIIVETNETLRAFEREIKSLEQAFKESGFAEAHLDMSLASGSEGNGANPQAREDTPFFSEHTAAAVYDAAADHAETPNSDATGTGLALVNMLA